MMMQVLYTVIAVLAVATCATASCDTLQKENEKLSQIETRLDNLTSQFSAVTLLSTESPLTGVTSLLQLSLLRELLTGYRKESSSRNESNEEGLATLQRMEALLNTSIVDIAERLNSLAATVSSIQKDTRMLLDHSNVTHTTLNEIDGKLINPEDEDDYTPSTLYHSCEEVLKNSPNSSSGYYKLADATGHARHVYCHMNNLCNSGGGWNRVSILNMTNSKEKCPVGLRLYNQNGRRACGRPYSGGASCPGVKFPVHFKYSQVCGKVIGYQKGFPDGTKNNAEGVKLTHGTSRNHIWSFIASPLEVERFCPCSSGPAPPSYVGSDYYCESGDPDSGIDVNRMYTNDPLWDGKNCRSLEAPCCTTHSLIPWFHKKLGYTTTDYIEMRLCFSEGTNDEDSPVEQYEIYVK